MNFSEAIRSGFNNYFNFRGRAPRSAFWFWTLFLFLGNIVLSFVDYAMFGSDSFSPLTSLFSLGTFIPTLAVGARRLHDINRTGWWQLLCLVPIIGFIVLLIWFIKAGDRGDNLYGPDPLGGTFVPIRP